MDELPAIRRILVALDASRQSLYSLEIAAALASRRQAELLGLFIEDVNLIHLAGLPFAREVDRFLAVAREIDSLRITRALRAEAEQVRRVLSRVAEELKVPSSFQVVRGHYIAEALSAATSMDVLLLCRMGRARSQAWGTAFAGQAPQGMGQRPVGVIYDGTPASDRALVMAGEIAHAEGSRLVVLLVAGEADALRARAVHSLGDLSPSARFVVIPSIEPAHLAYAVGREGCAFLVLPRESLSREATTTALLEGIECPVALVP